MWAVVVTILQPFIEIRDGRHPCLSRTVSGGDFIPNDIVIGRTDVSFSRFFYQNIVKLL